MPDSKPKEITQAEELISAGKKQEALEVIKKFQRSAWPLFYRQEYDKSLEIGLLSKELIEKVGVELDIARNYLLLGWNYSSKGDFKSSLNYGMKCIDLFQKLNDQVNLAASYQLVGFSHISNGDSDLAIEFSKKALSIEEILPINKAGVMNLLASQFTWRGDIPQSQEYCKAGLKIAEREKFENFQNQFLFYTGVNFMMMSDFDKAKYYLKKCIDHAEKHEFDRIKGLSLLYLTDLYVEKNDMDKANAKLELLHRFAVLKKNEMISKIYSVARGIVLYQSSRARDRVEAETLFREVIESIPRYPQLYIFSLYCLIFIYIEEFRISNDLKILEDINPLISMLFRAAEDSNSYLFLTEAKIFQAKIELIQMNFDKAKGLLVEAQQIAEENKIYFFAQIISDEHDRLLEYQDIRGRLNHVNPPRLNRIRLASLNSMTDLTQRDYSEEPIKLVPENPMFLLIMAEHGAPLFSYSFSKELSFEDDIISSFISAFNSFSGELFSKGLDRARFGEYTILIETVDSYSVCYLFKGQSYPAKQKLINFIEELQENPAVWQIFDTFFKTSQVAELQDIPQIENLIKDIFVK